MLASTFMREKTGRANFELCLRQLSGSSASWLIIHNKKTKSPAGSAGLRKM